MKLIPMMKTPLWSWTLEWLKSWLQGFAVMSSCKACLHIPGLKEEGEGGTDAYSWASHAGWPWSGHSFANQPKPSCWALAPHGQSLFLGMILTHSFIALKVFKWHHTNLPHTLHPVLTSPLFDPICSTSLSFRMVVVLWNPCPLQLVLV